MSFDLVAYDKLKKAIIEGIETLIRSYLGKDYPIDPEKLHEHVAKLKDHNKERRTQCEYLLQVINFTNDMDHSTVDTARTRARILNAAAFRVYRQIEKSYDEAYLASFTPSFISSPDGSTLYTSLRNALVINDENKPSGGGLFDMYTDLKEFLCRHVYKDGNRLQTFLPIQPFSKGEYYPKGVYHFNVVKEIDDLTTIICSLELALSKKAVKLHEDSIATASQGGFFGWLIKGSKSTAAGTEPTSTVRSGL